MPTLFQCTRLSNKENDWHASNKDEKNTHSPAKEGFVHLPGSTKGHQSVANFCLSPHQQDTWPGKEGEFKSQNAQIVTINTKANI
jgi:hypothetical protein